MKTIVRPLALAVSAVFNAGNLMARAVFSDRPDVFDLELVMRFGRPEEVCCSID